MYKSKNEPGSRSQMLQWINRTLNINQTKIENLASGVIYCMLVNHFHANTIPASKIILNPKSHHDYRTNLRKLQEGLSTLDIKNIGFDVFKVAEMTYAENWNLICKIYRQFNGEMYRQNNGERGMSQMQVQSKWPMKVNENRVDTPFSKGLMSVNPLSTPMKPPKVQEEGGKIRWQTMNTIQEIKRIVAVQTMTDRIKVDQLRHLLGLKDEQGLQSEGDLKDLLSDYKKQEFINID